jgi:hypothetical protein
MPQLQEISEIPLRKSSVGRLESYTPRTALETAGQQEQSGRKQIGIRS